jgi:hypothetical protein
MRLNNAEAIWRSILNDSHWNRRRRRSVNVRKMTLTALRIVQYRKTCWKSMISVFERLVGEGGSVYPR